MIALLTLPLLDVMTAARPALAHGPLDLHTRPRTHPPLPEKSPRERGRGAGCRRIAGDARGRRGRVGEDVWHGRPRGVPCHRLLRRPAGVHEYFWATESRLLLFRIKDGSDAALDGYGRFDEGYRPGVPPPRQPGLGGRSGTPWSAKVEAEWSLRIELAIDMTASGEVYHGHWSLPTASKTSRTGRSSTPSTPGASRRE